MITIILGVVLCLVLVVAASALVFGGLKIHELVGERSQRVWVAMLALVYLSPALAILASGRDLRAEALLEDLSQAGNVASALLGKVGYYGLLGLCAVVLMSRLFDSKSWTPIPRQARWLLGAMLAYVAGATMGSAFFGTRPHFIPLYLGAPLLLSAAVLLALHPAVNVLQGLRNVLGVLVLASLATAIVLPAMSLETYNAGLIPGLTLRFWGLTTHANAMGPLAALGLLLCIAKPFPNRWLQSSMLLACLMATLLAQSKTTWLATLAALFVFVGVRNLERPQDALLRWAKLAFAGAAVAVAAILMANGGFEAISDNTQDKALGGGDFSGRPIIWEIAVNEWKKNPLFGYGPSIWSPEYRARIGMNFAFHAHSQFFQTLSEAGAVGVALLSLYILTIATAVTRQNPERALGVAILFFVIVRSISEPTFRVTAAISGDTMIHLVLLCVAVTAIRGKSILPGSQL